MNEFTANRIRAELRLFEAEEESDAAQLRVGVVQLEYKLAYEAYMSARLDFIEQRRAELENEK